MIKHKTFFNWSTGKDAALALHYLRQDQAFHVDRLLTTINAHYDRVSMHGLRRELLDLQVKAIGLPSSIISLPEQPTMEEYEEIMSKKISDLKEHGYTHTAFGDIFLEDLRSYREHHFNKLGIVAKFPLWKKNTRTLIKDFLAIGFKAVVVAAKAEYFDETFVGKEIDHNFLNELPQGVDPCGENGEFHTFCFDGPLFSSPVSFEVGKKVFREYDAPNHSNDAGCPDKMGFWFCDLLPK